MDDDRAGRDGMPRSDEEWREWKRQRRERRQRRFPLFGLALLLIGIAWLGDKMGWWSIDEDYAGPLVLITLGAIALLRWALRQSRGS